MRLSIMNNKRRNSKILSVRLFFLMANVGYKMVLEFRLIMFLMIQKLMVVFFKKKLLKLIFLNALLLFLIIPLLLCTSCKIDSNLDDPFFQLYKASSLESLKGNTSQSHTSNYTLSFSANKIPFSLLARVISDRFNIGVVFSESLSQKLITAEFKDTNLYDCLNVLSRQLDSDIVPVGNTYYIGKLRSEDRGILVRKVLGYKNDDLHKSISGVISDKGKVSVIGSGVVSVSDYQSVIVRVSELLDYISRLNEPVWILQLAFITLNREVLIEAGVKITTSGTLSYNLDDNEFSAKNINIDGIINSALSSSFTDVHSCPMLLIREGTTSEWKYGKRIPIPRKTVSSYGTITTTGFDYQDVGFTVKATLSRSHIGGILNLSIGKSDVESYVEYAPVIGQNVYVFTCDMSPRKPYLLGELSTFKDLNSQTDILNFGKTRGKNSVQVWGQIYCIIPGVSRKYPYIDPDKLKKTPRD